MKTTINPLFGKSLIFHLLLISSLFSLPTLSNAQYLEPFNTPNKGYLLNLTDDFSGVNWTLTPWATAGGERDVSDYFQTTATGVLESIDIDAEVCWESPLLNISAAGTVNISVGLVWNGFDNDVVANTCATGTTLSLDYIKVMYSINGGAFTMVPNQVGGATCATIGYSSGMGSGLNGTATVTQGGISGTSLRIRVCVGTNANAELVQIDNVSVPQAGVTLNCSQPVLTTAVKNIVCNGPNSGSIDLSVSGGTPGYTYAWTVPATTQDVSGLAVGTYSVTVTDAAMCSQTTSATIISSPIVQNALTFPASCSQANGAIDLTVSGGNLPYTYAWTGGATTQDLSGITAGSYTVTITDASIPACTSTATYTVGTSATGPYSETFSTPNRGYKINQVDDFLGVKWTLSPWTLDEPVTGIGRDNGDYFQTTAGGKLQSVDTDQEVCWISPELNISGSGTVQFSVDLAWIGFDPEDYISVEYSINGGAFILLPNAVGGGAKTIQYAAGVDISSSTTVTKTGLTGNKLQIRVCVLTNSNGDIVDIDNVSVPQSVSFCFGPTVNAGSDQILCITSAPVTLAATLSDGTGAWSVLSGPSTANSQFSSLSSPTATFTPAGGAGTYILRWTGTNSGGTSTDDVTIKLDAAAFVNAGPDQTVCASNPVVQLAASFSGATTNIVWSINPPFGAFSNDVSPTSTYTLTAGDIAAGSVTLTINTNDPAGVCNSVSDMMTIFIDPKATVNGGADYGICQTATSFPALNGQIGGAATSATWSGGTGTFTPNANTLNATYNPSAAELASPGAIVLTLTTNDPAGLCGAASDNLTLTIGAAAFVNAGPDQTVCASNPVVQLAASFSGATTNIVWSINPPFGAFSNDVSPTSTYTLTAGDIAAGSVTLTINTNDPAGACNSATDMMTIFINQLATPTVSLSVAPSNIICAGTTVTFTATPTNGGSTPQYKWFKNNIEILGETNATLIRSDLVDQDKIKVQLTSNAACLTTSVATSNEITMTVYSPSVEAGDCKYVYLGYDNPSNCTTLTAIASGGSGGFTYLWTPGNKTGATIQVCPTTTTTYTVKATDSYGCKATDMVKVEVINVRCGNKKDNKVLVCHNGSTLCLDKVGVPDHLAHGDKLGTCGTIACGLALRSAESSVAANSQNKTSSSFTLQCYPNPADDVLTVQLNNITEGVAQLEILDVTGREVLKQNINLTEGDNSISLDISQLSRGIFIIKLTDSQNQKAWVKMVKE